MWVQRSSKFEFELDGVVVVVGVAFILLGGFVSVAGVQFNKGDNNSAPSPVLGAIIVAIGAAICVVGILMLLTNGIAWMIAHRPSKKSASVAATESRVGPRDGPIEIEGMDPTD